MWVKDSVNNVNKWMFFEFVLLNNLQNLQNGEILQKNDYIWLLSVKSNITTSMSLAFAIHKVIHDIMLSLCSFWNWPLTMFILSFHTWYLATPSYYHFWSRPNVCGFSSDIFFSLAPLEFGHFILITSFFFALFRRRFSFHRFAISTIIRGEKKEAHQQRRTCLSRAQSLTFDNEANTRDQMHKGPCGLYGWLSSAHLKHT